jgi:limonene-1,2-epoxide hydrolase
MGETEPTGIVKELFDGWRAKDPDRIAALFTEDAVYHNIPMSVIKGREEIRAAIAGWLQAMGGMEFRFNHILSGDGIVMMERVDVIPRGDGTHELPVMGVLEFEGDKISAWREYFDMEQMRTTG